MTDTASVAAGTSRRRFLYSAAVIAAAGPLAACGGGTKKAGSSTAQAPSGGAQIHGQVPGPPPVSGGNRGGRISALYVNPWFTNDPALTSYPLDYDVGGQLAFFGGLLAYGGQDGGPVANIADLPQISADGRTLTFRLRNAKFHNGRQITAHDVKWSWERTLAPATKSWGVGFIPNVIGVDAVEAGKTKKIEGVEAVDDRTLKVHLKVPDSLFLYAICISPFAPVPREEVERLGAKWAKTPVGYGPYRIDSWDETQQIGHLSRFDEYMYAGLPYLDEIEIRWGVNTNSALQELKAGSADFLPDLLPDAATTVHADPAYTPLVTYVPPTLNFNAWMFNFKKPEVQDPRVRRALNFALDRASIERVTHGAQVPLGRPFATGIAGYHSPVQPYTYDPKQAKSLLAEAGFAKGLELSLGIDNDPSQSPAAQIFQQNLRDIGVKLNISVGSPQAIGSDAKFHGKFHMYRQVWQMSEPTYAEPVDGTWTTSSRSDWYGHYSNPKVDKLAAQAHATYKSAEQNAIYAQIESILAQDNPAVWVSASVPIVGHSKRLQNIQHRNDTLDYYDRLWV
jgi:ABC-type transport system substrate-binding protein